MDIRLKWCPFCGGKAELVKGIILDYLCSVNCTNCRVSTKLYESEEEAVEVWNRRIDEW